MRQFIIAIAMITVAVGAAMAQSSTGTAVVRRTDTATNSARQPDVQTGQVSDRMQQRFTETERSEADAQWMKVVYRQLDLEQPANAALYYPEDAIDGQENLFRIIMRLLTGGSIPAYEYLDGRELFTDEYRLNVADLLDRFHILYTEAKGSTARAPRYEIDPSDVPTSEVLSYYMLERWELDSRTNRMHTIIDAICPVLHRSGDFGGEAVKYPMFWVKMSALRPHLAAQPIFIDDDNNLARYTYDDFFQLALYNGDIYKTRNLHNKSMMQLYPDPDALRQAQDSIQNYLTNFEKKMWVPSREEIIAQREQRELMAAGDTLNARQVKPAATRTPARTARAGKATRTKTTKVSRPKTSSSSSSQGATRSVRRSK